MRKLFVFIFCAAVISCTNNKSDKKDVVQDTLPTACTFGLPPEAFDTVKAPPVQDEVIAGRKPVRPTQTQPPAPTGTAVILLDFDGHLVTGTQWNYAGDVNAANANLDGAKMQMILDSIAAKFSLWQVVVTTDEALYNRTEPSKRQRVIFTESYEWYGRTSGTSFVGSFGKESPCFVFTSLLSYDARKIYLSALHELGHTLGLLHESIFDAAGAKQYEYNPGGCATLVGCGLAPIMGNPYNQTQAIFLSNGINAYNKPVDEFALISAKIPRK